MSELEWLLSVVALASASFFAGLVVASSLGSRRLERYRQKAARAALTLLTKNGENTK